MSVQHRIRSKKAAGSGGVIVGGFTDDFSIGIKVTDSNAAPTDEATFLINLALSDTNTAQTELLKLGISGPGFNDSNAVPTDGKTAVIKYWLNGTTGSAGNTTNPTRADGQNDGSFTDQRTVVLGATTSQLTSLVGNNVGAVSFTSVIYQGYFTLATTLLTSVARVVANSATGLFADITMITLSAVGGSVNHSTGTFSFDLLAAGVDTLAKIQSLRILHVTIDAVAGVTPAVITVDAGNVQIGGVF